MFANMLYPLHPRNGEQLTSTPHSQLMCAFYFKGCSSKPGQRALIVGQIRQWREMHKRRPTRIGTHSLAAAYVLASLGPINHKPTHEEV